MSGNAHQVIPNPDPSARTSSEIDRTVAASEARVLARIDGIEKTIDAQHGDLVRVPTLLDRAVSSTRDLFISELKAIQAELDHLRKDIDAQPVIRANAITDMRHLVYAKIDELAAVTMEKFGGVNGQFMERDTRTDQRAGDTKLAVDAAFAAAKEATAKIEAGFTKQIDGMADVIKAIAKNADDKISDLKDRLTALESRGQGVANLAGWIFGAVGMLVGVAVVVLTIMRH